MSLHCAGRSTEYVTVCAKLIQYIFLNIYFIPFHAYVYWLVIPFHGALCARGHTLVILWRSQHCLGLIAVMERVYGVVQVLHCYYIALFLTGLPLPYLPTWLVSVLEDQADARVVDPEQVSKTPRRWGIGFIYLFLTPVIRNFPSRCLWTDNMEHWEKYGLCHTVGSFTCQQCDLWQEMENL